MKKKIEIWNIQNQLCEFNMSLELKEDESICSGSVIEGNENHLIFTYGNRNQDTGTMVLWDILQNKCLFKETENISYGNLIQKITFQYFFLQSNICELKIYEMDTCKWLKTLTFPKRIMCITYGYDLNQLLIVLEGGTIEFWGSD